MGCSAARAADGARFDGSCRAEPFLAAAPTSALDVRQFGARADGDHDDSAAIQAALDALEPGQWLVFPAGRYRHTRRLTIAREDVTLDGRGATLHASNADDQALLVQAGGVRIAGFTLTAVTDQRRAAPWHSRIAVWRDGDGLAPLHGVQILGNRIVECGPPGSSGANCSSSAAIFVHNARAFVVAGNVVRRSLSDGIHITGGSQVGQVVANNVRESGDDMIAVVSYLGAGDASLLAPAQVAATIDVRRRRELVRDVLISGNDVAAPYWGRGISVVGGEDIGIVDNRIDASTHGAAIYIAREAGYATFGVRNVRVERNHITRVQTTRPAYSVLPLPARLARTGHGAIELVAHQFSDEAAIARLREALTVEGVLVAANRIEDAGVPGVRIGYGWNQVFSQVRALPDGRVAQRRFGGARVSTIVLQDNRLMQVERGVQVLNGTDPARALACAGNVLDGRDYAPPRCDALTSAAEPITGTRVACAVTATRR